MEISDTLMKIHASAKNHFMANGYERSSLRKIVSDVGFTLGAFYGYYGSKEELFHALVEETASGILAFLKETAVTMNALPDDLKLQQMNDVFSARMPLLVDFLFQHRDETYLLLRCSDGTRYENFLAGMMEEDLQFMAQAAGMKELPLQPLAQKLLVESYFSLLGQAALEGTTREEIMETMQDIQSVFTDGMVNLLQRNNRMERGKQE